MQLSLSGAARRRLRTARKHAKNARLFRRLQAVLLVGEGRPVIAVADTVAASRRSVHYWCAAYTRRRRDPVVQALGEKPRRGRRPVLPALSRERLL